MGPILGQLRRDLSSKEFVTIFTDTLSDTCQIVYLQLAVPPQEPSVAAGTASGKEYCNEGMAIQRHASAARAGRGTRSHSRTGRGRRRHQGHRPVSLRR